MVLPNLHVDFKVHIWCLSYKGHIHRPYMQRSTRPVHPDRSSWPPSLYEVVSIIIDISEAQH